MQCCHSPTDDHLEKEDSFVPGIGSLYVHTYLRTRLNLASSLLIIAVSADDVLLLRQSLQQAQAEKVSLRTANNKLSEEVEELKKRVSQLEQEAQERLTEMRRKDAEVCMTDRQHVNNMWTACM